MSSYQPKHKKFSFDGWQAEGNSIVFRYSFADELKFEEKLTWPSEGDLNITPAIENAANLYLLLAGVSYYKAYPAPQLELKDISLDDFQAEFLSRTYRQGLGEFLYENELDPSDIARFRSNSESSLSAVEGENLNGTLLMIGGGKDSLVSADLLKKSGKDFTAFRVNTNEWVSKQIEKIGSDAVFVNRVIDSKISNNELPNALNGHVPVTAIVSAAAVLTALINGHKNVVASNEYSASIPNTVYKGMEINHQYSKSEEFEQGLKEFISKYVCSEIEYFSLLRGASELLVSGYFAKNVLPEFRGLWSSSNHNFKFGSSKQTAEWEMTSPKTLSVFGMLSAFVGPSDLTEEFGQDLYALDEAQQTWNELVGNTKFKPFECVASIEEMQLAVNLAKQNGWQSIQFNAKENNLDYKKKHSDFLPKGFKDVINNL